MNKVGKVLLIDDSTAVNNRNESILKSMNCFEKFVKHTSAKAAIEFLKDETSDLPQLILLDISMPDQDGFEFLDEYIELKKVRESDYWPVIAMVSDYLLEGDNFDKSKDYKTYGVVEHIKKPIDKEDITNIIEEHLEGSNA